MKERKRYGEWTVGERLGAGGNGVVFAAIRGDETGALKLLKSREQSRRLRFADEIAAMRRCVDIPGVLPILDASVDTVAGPPWFVMGRAIPIRDALANSMSLRRVVEGIRQIAGTLAAMHARDVSHRDLKPENLFLFQDRWSVGDFGLADFAGKAHETEVGERIGPIHYIAPEMLNSATTSSGLPADVYSLSKVLWVLATGQTFPLPGQYLSTEAAFRIGSYVLEGDSAGLDALITACTAFGPKSRPTMQRFREELDAWLAPTPAPAQPIALDVSAFRARLNARAAELAAERETARAKHALAERNGLRLREQLRPLSKDLETSLRAAGFESVGGNLDNLQWGLDVQASVPTTEKKRGVQLALAIHATSVSDEVHLNCRYSIRVTGESPSEFLVWHKELTYMPGGPREELIIGDLDRAVRERLQMAVTSALELSFVTSTENDKITARYVLARDEQGAPVGGAVVLLVAQNGLFYRDITNQQGQAAFMVVRFFPVTVMIAHARYPAVVEEMKDPVMNATLRPSTDVVGSFVATSGWTPVPGLSASLNFKHDASDRRYVYGDNVAINGGEVQPVRVALGTKLSLQTIDGSTAAVVPRAFCGSCFVLDLRRD